MWVRLEKKTTWAKFNSIIIFSAMPFNYKWQFLQSWIFFIICIYITAPIWSNLKDSFGLYKLNCNTFLPCLSMRNVIHKNWGFLSIIFTSAIIWGEPVKMKTWVQFNLFVTFYHVFLEESLVTKNWGFFTFYQYTGAPVWVEL